MNVFVTGGSRGVGEGIVRGLVAAGHDVGFTWREREDCAAALLGDLRAAFPERRIVAWQLDVRDPAAVDRVADAMLDQLGGVDAVVCNAGITQDQLLVQMSDQAWRDVIDTNLTGSFFVARRFVSELVGQRAGRIVFISSIARSGVSGQANYAASKAGLAGLSATIAKEYGRRGVTSNVLVLGVIDTGIARATLNGRFRKAAEELTPAGRFGTPEDVAAAVCFLLSDGAAFLTGQELGVNGGLEWGP